MSCGCDTGSPVKHGLPRGGRAQASLNSGNEIDQNRYNTPRRLTRRRGDTDDIQHPTEKHNRGIVV